MNTKQISSLLDLTLLDPKARLDDIHHLVLHASQLNAAALCVMPEHLDWIPEKSPLTRATVVNFPTGNQPHHDVLKAIDTIQHADEIDYVFPYQAYLAGSRDYALACSAEAYQRCQQQGFLFKVILETGAAPSSDVIYQLSRDVINAGCDFLKTSTGKIAIGATIPAATAMLTAIIDSKKPCGIKVSGGIKTIEQATHYIVLAENMMGMSAQKHWFRIGTSGLLNLCYT